VQAWGTWRDFLRAVGEYTEASYHYPQGTHLGHILSILWYYGLPSRTGSQFEDKYVRLRGGYGEGRLGTYQRQLRYKLQATMELGLIEDDRGLGEEAAQNVGLTALGMELRRALEGVLANVDLRFGVDDEGVPSTRMAGDEDLYNTIIREAADSSAEVARIVHKVFLNMPAVEQMMRFLYQIARKRDVPKEFIYSGFFEAPFVQRFCEQEGIEPATLEASRRRCPFLLNVLAACRVLRSERSAVRVDMLVLTPALVQHHAREDPAVIMARFRGVVDAWPAQESLLDGAEVSILRELFGSDFLTDSYTWSDLDYSSEEVR
jgi:hypothetical protein